MKDQEARTDIAMLRDKVQKFIEKTSSRLNQLTDAIDFDTDKWHREDSQNYMSYLIPRLDLYPTYFKKTLKEEVSSLRDELKMIKDYFKLEMQTDPEKTYLVKRK